MVRALTSYPYLLAEHHSEPRRWGETSTYSKLTATRASQNVVVLSTTLSVSYCVMLFSGVFKHSVGSG
jgi:hypothetical protein